MIPSLAWQTPIFHPNISSGGVVCLGGYGTHWVPSLTLDEMCIMLWDMIRYRNYDSESPYNREAAIWVKNQTQFALPIDNRPLRNLVADASQVGGAAEGKLPPVVMNMSGGVEAEVEIIDAEPVNRDDGDIVFID